MTIYNAIALRSSGLAKATDEMPSVAQLVKTLGVGMARWAEKSRQDVRLAKVEAIGYRGAFVVRVRPRESIFTMCQDAVLTTFVTAASFFERNPDAIDVTRSLVGWATEEIAHGAKRFETRWSPDGWFAITAVQ